LILIPAKLQLKNELKDWARGEIKHINENKPMQYIIII